MQSFLSKRNRLRNFLSLSAFVVGLLPLVGSLAMAPSGEPVRVETIEREFPASFVKIRLDEEPSVEFEEKSVPLRDVLRLGFLNTVEYRREIVVTLADGSRMHGGIGRDSDDVALSFNGPLVAEGVRIPLEWVRRVDFRGLQTNARSTPPEEKLPDSISDDTDAVITRSGGVLTGVVERITGTGVTIENDDLGKVEQPWNNVRTVVVAPIDTPPTLPEGAIHIAVEGADDSLLHGSLVEFDRNKVRLRSPLIGDLTIPLERLKGVSFLLGRVDHLSDRTPSRVKEGNPYTTPATFQRFFSWRRDRNVVGDPITIGERSFRKGIGVHSESRIAFPVAEGDLVFQSWIGLDSSARPKNNDPEVGSVIFKVLLDGEVRFNSGEVSWQTQPRRIELNLRGAKELELVVEMGNTFHILDRANWGDARVLRE